MRNNNHNVIADPNAIPWSNRMKGGVGPAGGRLTGFVKNPAKNVSLLRSNTADIKPPKISRVAALKAGDNLVEGNTLP